MIRPNLAPLALVVAALVFTESQGRLLGMKRLLVYGACAAVGPALILWSQAALYGHPFTPGYAGYRDFFSVGRVGENARVYASLLVDMHTPLILAALVVAPYLAWRAPASGPGSHRAAAVALAAVALVCVNYALFLPYLTYTGWDALRFMLPGLTAIYVLFAALVDQLRRGLAARAGWLAVLALLPLLIVLWPTRERIEYVFSIVPGYRRVQLAGRYMREALPPNAVILSFLQSGATVMYTGRPIIRLDVIDPASLDRIVEDLLRRGHRPMFLVDDLMESRGFRERFKGSLYQMMDWLPRAQFASPTELWLMDPADRPRYVNGERWPVDVLVWPPG
jgi:hypothetical protein